MVDAILKQLKLGNSTIQVRILSWLPKVDNSYRNKSYVSQVVKLVIRSLQGAASQRNVKLAYRFESCPDYEGCW